MIVRKIKEQLGHIFDILHQMMIDYMPLELALREI